MTTRLKWWRALAGMSLVGALAGCKELQVENSNAPERERAFSDPATIINSALGTMNTFYNMRYIGNVGDIDLSPGLVLSTQADSYSASWNNFTMRYYSSYGPTGGANCLDRCAWVNAAGVALGAQVEPWWYGSYSVLSSANDALFAIREAENPPDLGADADLVEVVAQMAQAMALAWIALNYDQGFIVLENSDVTQLTLEPRQAIRDKAIELLEQGITLAKGADPFQTGPTTFGPGGPVYTNLQLAKVMRTLQAELLAHYPRNATENAQVDWAKVAEYASKGTSSGVDGAPFRYIAFQDENLTFWNGYMWWGGATYASIRVDTRVTRLLSKTQNDPWINPGNPRPTDASGIPIGGLYGVDLRMGDGCYDGGTGEDNVYDYGECKETPLSGTDYGHVTFNQFNQGRGLYHNSEVGHTRYTCLGISGTPDCPVVAGDWPLAEPAFNDLLWAEGLLRSGGSTAEAATRINNSRVGRGGLPPVSAANTNEELLRALAYEQDVELIQYAGTQFYNRRRVTKDTYTPGNSINKNLYTGVDQVNPHTADQRSHYQDPEGPHVLNTLWLDTPRQMPLPAKDLALLRMEIYTFGGPGNPTGISPPQDAGYPAVRNVREIWADMMKRSRISIGNRRH